MAITYTVEFCVTFESYVDLFLALICNQWLDLYTVSNEKHATLFLIITLAFLGRLLYFLHSKKRKEYSTQELRKFTTSP